MTVESEIRDADRVLARARVVVVFFDLTGGRSTEPDPEMREALLAASYSPAS
jgi:acyl-CoA thioester hydrolase